MTSPNPTLAAIEALESILDDAMEGRNGEAILSPGVYQRIETTADVAAEQLRALLAALEERTREVEEANRDLKAALRETGKWAAQAGEAKGRLEMSEAAGIVDGWRERAEAAESALSTSRERERELEKALEAVDRTLGDGDEGLPNGWLSRCERSLKTIRQALALRPLVVGDDRQQAGQP
jgi:DNA repair exonuclease SbcCD ATPase subunit